MKHLISQGGDMLAAYIIALPLAIVGIPVLFWLIYHGLPALTYVLEALRTAVIG